MCQSHAADLIKERAVALHRENEKWGAHMLAIVHDEILNEVPVDVANEYSLAASTVLNQSSVPLRVPVRSSCGISTENWRAAKD